MTNKAKKKAPEKAKIVSAQKFYDKKSMTYVFPFQLMDDTPGGKNLGRIHWCVEPVVGRKEKDGYWFKAFRVWARSTRDKRYAGKVFEIPCNTRAIMGRSLDKEKSFLNNVWLYSFCEEHKTPIMDAYPPNGCSKLRIETFSSFGVDISFE